MSREQELRVAHPRGRNPQLPESQGATMGGGSATAAATIDLKAMASSYLERKQRNQPCNTSATDAEETAQLWGDSEGEEVALDSAPYSEERPDWLAWIEERCPLVRGDRTHIVRGLYPLHPKMQQRLAERYVEEWGQAANAEPKPHKKDNAGRRAANLIITQLLKETS